MAISHRTPMAVAKNSRKLITTSPDGKWETYQFFAGGIAELRVRREQACLRRNFPVVALDGKEFAITMPTMMHRQNITTGPGWSRRAFPPGIRCCWGILDKWEDSEIVR